MPACTTLSRRWIAIGLLLIMLTAPLYRAGQPPLALMGLELGGVLLLFGVLWRPPRLSRSEWIAIAGLVLLPLLYLVPLPLGVIEQLPGRSTYLEVWRIAFGDQGLPATAQASLVPRQTEAAWLLMLVPIGVFLAVRSLAPSQLPVLLYVLIGIAGAQAALGLMQFGDGAESPLYLQMEYTHFGSAVGTYTNRNHLAGLIEMALPIALALLFYTAGLGRDRRRTWHARAAFLSSVRGHEALIYAALLILLLLGVIFSRSRMGISMAMLGVLLSVFLFSRRIGGDNVFGPVGSLIAIAVGLSVAIGLLPVLDRFSVEAVAGDLRWLVFGATFNGIGTFFPAGSGPGTYGEIFPAFQPLELGRWFVNRAHNDYLEWVFEGGVAAALLIGALLALYLRRWRRVWVPGAWTRLRFVQVGAGIGMLLILLHETVDYNLHIPANIVFFSVLAGVFFSDAGEAVDVAHQSRSGGQPQDDPVAMPADASLPPVLPAPDQIRNPFLDD